MQLMATSLLCIVTFLSVANCINWEYGAYPLPEALAYGQFISYDESIMYIFMFHGTSTSVYKLDTNVANPSWNVLSSNNPNVTLPSASPSSDWQANFGGTAKINDKVYTYSGYNQQFHVFDINIESFISPTTRSPISINNQVVAGDNNQYIYLIGGLPYTKSNYVIRYDTMSNSFTTMLSTAPQTWYNPCTVYYQPFNYIYVFGGQNGQNSDYLTGIYYYDITNNQWSDTIGIVLNGIAQQASAIYVAQLDLIYIIQGNNGNGVGSFDPNTNVFQIEQSRNSCTGWTHIGLIDSRIQLFGGSNYPERENTNCRTEYLYPTFNPSAKPTSNPSAKPTFNPIASTSYPTSPTSNPVVSTSDSTTSTSQFVCSHDDACGPGYGCKSKICVLLSNNSNNVALYGTIITVFGFVSLM